MGPSPGREGWSGAPLSSRGTNWSRSPAALTDTRARSLQPSPLSSAQAQGRIRPSSPLPRPEQTYFGCSLLPRTQPELLRWDLQGQGDPSLRPCTLLQPRAAAHSLVPCSRPTATTAEAFMQCWGTPRPRSRSHAWNCTNLPTHSADPHGPATSGSVRGAGRVCSSQQRGFTMVSIPALHSTARGTRGRPHMARESCRALLFWAMKRIAYFGGGGGVATFCRFLPASRTALE